MRRLLMAPQDPHFDFDHQQAISLKLNTFAHRMIAEKITLPEGEKFTSKHYVFFGLLNKLFTTHDAVRVLATHGYVDDGFSLVRTSAEALINAAYVVMVGGDPAAADYTDFHYYRD